MKQLNRTEGRETAVGLLYQVFLFDKNSISYDIDELINDGLEMQNDFVIDLVKNTYLNKEELDQKIQKNLVNWDLSRLGITDTAILRMATYELTSTETPNVVVINEAVNLAKKYSDDSVVKIVNAVLDNINKDL